jgi:hypothetical protein
VGAPAASETPSAINRTARTESARGGAGGAAATLANASGDARGDTAAVSGEDSVVTMSVTGDLALSFAPAPQLALHRDLVNPRFGNLSDRVFSGIVVFEGNTSTRDSTFWASRSGERRSLTSVIFAPIHDHGMISIKESVRGPTFSLLDSPDSESRASEPIDLPLAQSVLLLPDSLLPSDVDLNNLTEEQLRQLVGPYVKDSTTDVSLGRLDETGHITWALAPEPAFPMGALSGLMLLSGRSGRRR